MLSFESPVHTRWHNLPVGWKLIGVLFATVVLFIFDSILVQAFAFIVCVILYLVGSREFFVAGIQRLRFIWPFVVLILLWHTFTHTASLGVVIGLRLVTILGISNLMTMTSRLSDLIALIHAGLKPLRKLGVNTRPVEIAVALVVRFTPIFISKGVSISDAWRTRSVKKPGWRIVFPLSLAAIDDAEQVADALKARGGILQQS